MVGRRIVAALVLLPALQAPATAQPEELTLVDRVVAVVNDEPVLLSDIDRAIALGLATAVPDENETTFRRRVLDQLVDQRMRFQEVERLGFEEIPLAAVESQLDGVIARFDSPESFRTRLDEMGMEEEDLRQLLASQLQVLIYVDELLGARVFVDLEQITEYYQSVLVPRLNEEGGEIPPLDEVREGIRAVLREQRLNQELERWTASLRAESDIVDHFDRSEEALPPVVDPSSDQ